MGERRLPDSRAADSKVVISRYQPERDRDALLDFRRDHYGPQAVRAQGAYVDWQFQDAPQVSQERLPLQVARKEGRIVGTMGTIGTSLVVKGERWPAAWAVDFAVRRELRRSGIGEAIAHASRREPITRLVIDATAAAKGIVARGGYRQIAELPLFVRPLDPAGWMRSRGMPAALGWLSSIALPWLAVLDARSAAFARRERMELAETARFDERADGIFAGLSRCYPVLCRRDHLWLGWRFDRYPEPDRYRRYWLTQDGAAVGYAVLRRGTHKGAPSGMLVDYLCAPRLVPALLSLCLEHFRASGAAVATCLHLNRLAASSFRALGFFRRKSGWQFLVRPGSADDPAPVFDAESWFVTAGDGNVDRDRSELREAL